MHGTISFSSVRLGVDIRVHCIPSRSVVACAYGAPSHPLPSNNRVMTSWSPPFACNHASCSIFRNGCCIATEQLRSVPNTSPQEATILESKLYLLFKGMPCCVFCERHSSLSGCEIFLVFSRPSALCSRLGDKKHKNSRVHLTRMDNGGAQKEKSFIFLLSASRCADRQGRGDSGYDMILLCAYAQPTSHKIRVSPEYYYW